MLAKGVLDAVSAAESPIRGPVHSSLRVDIPAVLEARPLLLQIALRLRDRAPVNPHGVAIVSCILRDGDSPLYFARERIFRPESTESDLRTQARAALDSLDL